MGAPANPAFVDVLDTYYNFVTKNLATLNPARQVLGMMNAQDWPQVELVDGGLYLLYLRSVPIPTVSSRSQEFHQHFVQWSWVFIGDDLTQVQVGANRANRYRNNMAVVEELRQAHFPGFCPKQFSTCDTDTGVVTFTPYSPEEMIHWTEPRLGSLAKNAQSGVVYGTAMLELTAFSSVNPLLNV